MTEIERYLAVTPNQRQLAIQELGFYAFFHFGMNTMTDNQEWGTGKEDPASFNPKRLDTDQWCRCIKSAGMKGAILTAKHHDGFCLWPSRYTEHSVKNSPYKNGKGDIVKELSDSCKKYGLKLGIYLSPWDRNSEYYGTEKYDDFYINQLTELLTNYGDIFCIWMDGACGSHLDGKPVQVYDFPRYFAKINELQPMCALSNCGPDVRWVGNEAGYARSSEWSVVPSVLNNVADIAAKSQTEQDGTQFRTKGAECTDEDLGSRAVLEQFPHLIWYPAEVDVSIRPGWFYHKKEDKKVRSVDNLLNIYYNSVGGNCLLLLNIPPDKDGLISPVDEQRLKEMGDRLHTAFEKPVKATVSAPGALEGHSAQELLEDTETCYIPAEEQADYELTFDFHKEVLIDKVFLKEDTARSQRVERFELLAHTQKGQEKVFDGTVVGMRKIALFRRPVACSGFTLRVTQCRGVPCLSYVRAYVTDNNLPRPEPFYGLKKWWRKLNQQIYVYTENLKKKKAE